MFQANEMMEESCQNVANECDDCNNSCVIKKLVDNEVMEWECFSETSS